MQSSSRLFKLGLTAIVAAAVGIGGYAFLANLPAQEAPATALQTQPQETATEPETALVSATLKADGETYTLKLPEGSTALDLMEEVRATQGFTFTGQESPGFGFFVESINGVQSDTETNTYWLYFINGESAQEGISAYVLEEGDIIEWRYEQAN